MNLTQLAVKLSNGGVPTDAYSLSGGLPNEAYCIEKSGGRWHVYYSERGRRTGLVDFDGENEACEHLYSLVAKK
jgi:hypothetical protein